MSKVIIFSLGNGNLETGLPNVTAKVLEGERTLMQSSGSLPPAPEISQIYRRWQLLYQALAQRLGWSVRLEIASEEVIQVSEVEFADLCQQLQTAINTWLDSDRFRQIDRQFSRELKPDEEIQVIIETDDRLLRRLPWHLWNFFEHYPKAEIALSAPEYRVKSQSQTPTGRVRILAILGNSTGIDIESDRKLLQTLKGAELVLLSEPSRQELDRQLWDRRGWDIILFAGHSETEGEIGKIQINPTETLTIAQLKNALKQAIAGGLQLAIFNSCDGLGLARELEQLHVPQIVVMREPVPDRVAQEFLKYFLTELAGGKSLYQAVRVARERLQGWESQFPAASWLPVICQNPAVAPPTWEQLRGSDRLHPRRQCQTPLIVSVAMTILVLGMRSLGMLQNWELQAFDWLMRLRPDEGMDTRLLVVEATEEDVNQYDFPLPDGVLAEAIEKLKRYQPAVIGLDIWRDRPKEPGHQALAAQVRATPNLIVVCSANDYNNPQKPGIRSLIQVPPDRLGFTNAVADPNDRILRRHLLRSEPRPNSPCPTDKSLSLKIALHYLEGQGIHLQFTPDERLKLGRTVFPRLEKHTGGYHQLDARGYQLLLNYRATQQVAQQVSLEAVLNGEIDPNLVKGKIVLIGVTAPSVKDYHSTPYSAGQQPYQQMPGVVVQAQMVSQIVSAVLDGRPIIGVWSVWGEAVWIWMWSLLGGAIAWQLPRIGYAIAATAIAFVLLTGGSWVLFLQGTWVPLVPSGIAMLAAGSLVAFERKWRSK